MAPSTAPPVSGSIMPARAAVAAENIERMLRDDVIVVEVGV